MRRRAQMLICTAATVAFILLGTAATSTPAGASSDNVSHRAARKVVGMRCDGPGNLVLVTKVREDARVAAWIKGLDLPHDALWSYNLKMVSGSGASASIESVQRAKNGEWVSGRLVSRGAKSLTIRGRVETKSGSRECSYATRVSR